VFNLSQDSSEAWGNLVSNSQRPLFIVIDGTWTQAQAMLRKSSLLRSLPRVSFETKQVSEYGFKKQPHPACLSSVEGVHQVIEILSSRGWGQLPAFREHDQMIEIFRNMVKFQLNQVSQLGALREIAVS
jgi:DTW domain-containing protein YfiP